MGSDASGATASVAYDPYDRTLQRDPYPVYAELRAEPGLHYEPALDAHVASRFADDELLRRTPRVELVSDEVDWMASGLVRGPAQLPVVIAAH